MPNYKGWVFLEDEMPRIGSGLRYVEGIVGRKWVRLRSVTSSIPTDRSRIRLDVWKNIIRRTDKRGVPFND